MRVFWSAPAIMMLTSIFAQAADVFDVGSRAQLFVDRAVVRSAENVSFTLHPARKHPQNPLVKADRKLDGWRLALCGSVMYDEREKLFKMWYLGGNGTLYAESKDGLQWRKDPETFWRGYMFVSVIKDEADPDPARRYKIIAWCPNAPGVNTPGYPPTVRSGYNTSVSPDGRQIALFSTQKTICTNGDVITGYYDRRRKLYVAFPKIMTQVRGFNRRCFYTIVSKDFVEWSDPKPAFVPDELDDAGTLARIEEARPILAAPDNAKLMRTEFYGVGVYPHESCVIAFPWMLSINATSSIGTHEGPAEVQLAVSRDLEKWERPFRRPVIPRGKPDEWDGGFFWTSNEAVRVGDEIWLYYAAANFGHGNPCQKLEEGRLTRYTASIGLASWKLDRFVSADGGWGGASGAQPPDGVLTTVPLAFAGGRLEVNAATRADGFLGVEILNAEGRPVARSRPFAGDELRHEVQWESPVDLAGHANAAIALRFTLRGARLYSFAFRR